MSKVNDTSAEVGAMQKDWAILDALSGGTTAMRETGTLMTPKFPDEDEESRKSRQDNGVLFPAYERTVSVMAAKPFSKAITFGDDVPEEIKAWCENIDLQGVNLHAFAGEMFEESFSGLAGILVDTPKAKDIGRPLTKAEEKAANIRPYCIRVKHGSFKGWILEDNDGRSTLVMLRLCEAVSVRDGDFGSKPVEQIRVLVPGAWAIYRKADQTKDEWTIFDQGDSPLPYIPFVPLYGKRLGFMRGKPRLMNLAHQNVKHWRDSTDQDKCVRFARVRLAALIGVDDGTPVTVAADQFIKLPMGADIKVVQGSAESVKVGREELSALEEQMIQSGAELLVKKPGNRTATESANDAEGNKCDLQIMAEQFEDALDQVLQIMADYAKLGSGGHVTLFKDFGAATLGGASAALISDWWQAGLISRETAIDELKRRGQLAAEVTAEDEADKIAQDGPALGTLNDNPAPVQPAA